MLVSELPSASCSIAGLNEVVCELPNFLRLLSLMQLAQVTDYKFTK